MGGGMGEGEGEGRRQCVQGCGRRRLRRGEASELTSLAGGGRLVVGRAPPPPPPRLPAQMRISPLVPARFSAVRFLVASHCELDAAMFRDAVCGPYQILASALTVERHYDDRIKRLLVCVLSVSNMGIRAPGLLLLAC